MANAVIIDVALVSATDALDLPKCPWREYLRKANIPFKDLNYVNCDAQGREQAVLPFRSWFPENPPSVENMPFLVYQYAENMGGETKAVLHTNLGKLKADGLIKNASR